MNTRSSLYKVVASEGGRIMVDKWDNIISEEFYTVNSIYLERNFCNDIEGIISLDLVIN